MNVGVFAETFINVLGTFLNTVIVTTFGMIFVVGLLISYAGMSLAVASLTLCVPIGIAATISFLIAYERAKHIRYR